MLKVVGGSTTYPQFVAVAALLFTQDRVRAPAERWDPGRQLASNRSDVAVVRPHLLDREEGDRCRCCGRKTILNKADVVDNSLDIGAYDHDGDLGMWLEAGHGLAFSKGGPNVFQNLHTFCPPCNGTMQDTDDALGWSLQRVLAADQRRALLGLEKRPRITEQPFWQKEYDEWKSFIAWWVGMGKPELRYDVADPTKFVYAENE
jgi:hypothetical protein